MKRRLLCPEVVQTSDMDCGPAALAALLEGMNVPVSYEQLRELCQTDVDGTSIDALEEVAVELGIDAEQLMVPADHVLSNATDYFPSIVVTRLPNGFAHFVVAWRAHGGWVQVMDPASGRLFVRRREFIDNLFSHTMTVPEEDWLEWTRTEDFGEPFVARLKALGCRDAVERYRSAAASAEALCQLDAAARMTEKLCRSGTVKRGRKAVRLLDSAMASGTVPEEFQVFKAVPSEDGTALVSFTGAVLVNINGVQQAGQQEQAAGPSRVLAPGKLARPLREAFGLVRQDGLSRVYKVLGITAIVALCLIIEAVILRALFELPTWLDLPEQRLFAAAGLAVFFVLFLVFDVVRQSDVFRISRTLEARIRLGLLERLRRIPEHYIRSRPVSDLASRAHHAHRVRMIPDAAGDLARLSIEMLFTVVALSLVSPTAGLTAALLSPVLLGIPLSLQRLLSERDLRMETHAGALSRFYLDAMQGCFAVRTHRAEDSVQREHRNLLVEWARSGISFHRLSALVQASTSAFGAITAIAIIYAHLASDRGLETLILVTYWAVSLPTLGEQIALIVRQYPMARSAFLRVTEPTRSVPIPDEAEPRELKKLQPGPRAIDFDGVTVTGSGQRILKGIYLNLAAGSHTAVVGASGSGKSTLIATLLGLTHIESGNVRFNGTRLDDIDLAELRKSTAWIDPSVHLWNESLIHNLTYGNADSGVNVLDQVTEAELIKVLEGLPDGLQTSLGESGGKLSGGEGQRTRIGRALGREAPDLVLLDEAFRGLERGRRHRLMARLRDRWNNSTLVCVTHDLEQARRFPRVIVMQDGRIVEAGPPAMLLDGDGLFSSMLAEFNEAREIWESDNWRRVFVSNGSVIERES